MESFYLLLQDKVGPLTDSPNNSYFMGITPFDPWNLTPSESSLSNPEFFLSLR